LKRRKTDEERFWLDGNSWMVTFSDLLTLLLTFFVLLLSMSSLDNKVLRETFGFFSGTYGGLELEGSGIAGGVATPHDVRYPGMYFVPPGALLAEGFPEQRLAWVEGRGRAKRFQGGMIGEIAKAMKKGFAGLGLGRAVEIRSEKGDLVVRFSEGVLFEIGKARIGSRGRMVLEKAGQVLARFPNRVRMDPGRFSAVGYGEYKPLVPNTTSENRAKNRRAEIVVLSPPRKG